MLIFKEKEQFNDPFNVIFLCGSHFKKDDKSDKRIILKKYLFDSGLNCQVVILEENFTFGNLSDKLLSYDNIFLTNLSEVEILTSLYSDKILIIHESLSTAAELGMFASNTVLKTKIGVIYPDGFSIEEDKLSGFIKLAFFRTKDSKSNPTSIKYYPDIEVHRSSDKIAKYHTFFHDNEIGTNLGGSILSFLDNKSAIREIEFKSIVFDKPYSNADIVSYKISDDTIQVYVSATALRLQILAMLTKETVLSELLREKPLWEHVSFIENSYKEILLNTVCHIKGVSPKMCKTIDVRIHTVEDCDLRKAIGLLLYLLQAIGLIRLEKSSINNSEENSNNNIIIKKNVLKGFKTLNYYKYIYEKPETEYGRIMS